MAKPKPWESNGFRRLLKDSIPCEAVLLQTVKNCRGVVMKKGDGVRITSAYHWHALHIKRLGETITRVPWYKLKALPETMADDRRYRPMANERPRLWIRPMRVVRVVDGDTVDVTVDHGFRHYSTQRVRLLDINTPETKGESRLLGLKATHALTALLEPISWEDDDDPWGWMESTKGDSFGRWLGRLWLPDGTYVNEWMVTNGWATRYSGKGKNPTPWLEGVPYPIPRDQQEF